MNHGVKVRFAELGGGINLATSSKSKSKMISFSIFPKKLLYRAILGKIRDSSVFFISEKDFGNIRLVGNFTPIVFIVTTVVVYFITQLSLILALTIWLSPGFKRKSDGLIIILFLKLSG